MAWTVQPFNKLYYRVNGGTEHLWNGLMLPIRFADASNQLNTYGNTNHTYEYRRTRGNDAAEYSAMYALNGGSGADFWYYIKYSLANNQIIEITNTPGNYNICLVIQRIGSSQYRFGYSYYGTVTYLDVGAVLVYPAGGDGQEENTHDDLIRNPTINIGIITDGTKYSLYAVGAWGNQGAGVMDSESDENVYRLNTVQCTSAMSACLAILLTGNVPLPASPDPYSGIGTPAEEQLQDGPAQGSGDDSSDTISIPGAPALNLTLNHFISAYVPDLTTLNGLADFIWGNYDRFDSSKKLSKLFADPSDAIISLHMLPFTPPSSTAIEVTIGRYGSSINMPPLTAQFKDISCGTLTIDPYWANYLDHNPFTRYTLFLPFVGEVQLDPDEIVGETIGVDYRVDCLTGAFVCFVSTSTKILAQYQGNCSLQVPTSSADYSRLNSAILTAATAAVGGAVGVGAAAAGAAAGGVGAGIAAGAGEAAARLPGLAGNAMNVQQAKVNHSHSGALGGASGFLGSQKPYLLIHRARQSVPADANKFKGYPCNAKFRLGDLEGCGFTSVRRIKLDGIKLTEGELEELRQILAAGVYL